MSYLVHLLQTYGVLIVFGTVLLEQIGLPIPAMPMLIVAGALAAGGEINWAAAIAASVGACLVSDSLWFKAGRVYGKRVLRVLCKISLSPDYCVSQTEDKFRRWGAKSLVVAKFVPGFNTVAAPLSGAMGTPMPLFFAYSISGSVLWSASGIAIGMLFKDGIEDLLITLEDMGGVALTGLLLLLGAFLLYKYVERRRFHQSLPVERVRMEELAAMMISAEPPLIIDARSLTARQLEDAIPGALAYSDGEPGRLMASIHRDRHIVVYCSCPDDISAAQVARQFVARGFHRARALHGGLDAWNSHQASAA
ncbi:MAG: sulfurtransferase [Massilia sp.]|jgi:membrane protein DedA with SNARE-associated domain/rhodanese-related sulfurtransferase|nr:sulfurtransferase [Massilia sp.]